MVRFGISGCGGFIEKAVLPSIENVKNARAVAAFDVSQSRLGPVCARFGLKPCASFEELLDRDDVDVVYVASPNALHTEQAMAAAKAGKHVFCQKPMGINAAVCRKMITACRDNKVKLGIGFCYRFGGAQQKAKEMICAGAIGKVSYVHFSFNLGGYNKQTAGWRCDPRMSGGGPMMDVAPHMIDLAAYLLDDKVATAFAYVRPEPSMTEIETDVIAAIEFKGGVRMVLDTSFVRRNPHEFTLTGTLGQIKGISTMPWRLNGQKAGHLFLSAHGELQDVDFPIIEHLEEETRLYCQAIEKKQEPPVPGEAGLHAQAVVDAVYESGRTGRLCHIQE